MSQSKRGLALMNTAEFFRASCATAPGVFGGLWAGFLGLFAWMAARRSLPASTLTHATTSARIENPAHNHAHGDWQCGCSQETCRCPGMKRRTFRCHASACKGAPQQKPMQNAWQHVALGLRTRPASSLERRHHFDFRNNGESRHLIGWSALLHRNRADQIARFANLARH